MSNEAAIIRNVNMRKGLWSPVLGRGAVRRESRVLLVTLPNAVTGLQGLAQTGCILSLMVALPLGGTMLRATWFYPFCSWLSNLCPQPLYHHLSSRKTRKKTMRSQKSWTLASPLWWAGLPSICLQAWASTTSRTSHSQVHSRSGFVNWEVWPSLSELCTGSPLILGCTVVYSKNILTTISRAAIQTELRSQAMLLCVTNCKKYSG